MKEYLENNIEFEKYYSKVKEETRIIPELNNLTHGTSFCNDNYNAYDLSYLSIRYLSEIIEYSDFAGLMSNFEEIKNIGSNVLNDMFEYYDKKLMKKSFKI